MPEKKPKSMQKMTRALILVERTHMEQRSPRIIVTGYRRFKRPIESPMSPPLLLSACGSMEESLESYTIMPKILLPLIKGR